FRELPPRQGPSAWVPRQITMRKEFPFPGGAPLLGPSPGEVDRGQEQVQVARAFGLIRYKSVGHFTGALDYLLILIACIAAGVGYHSLILGGSVPDLMQYVGAGNIVAVLF